MVKGTIVEKDKNSENYQAIAQMQYTKKEKKWFSVEDITNMKTMQKKNKQRKLKMNEWKKMTIPITIQGRLEQLQDRHFVVRYDPIGDGNSHFSAVSHLLNRIRLHTSPIILRQNVIVYLRHNPRTNARQTLELFVGRPWKVSLREMEQDRTYGDQITLQTISNTYVFQINAWHRCRR